MKIHTLERRLELDGTPHEVFPFFADARNLEAITPPLLRFRVITPSPIHMSVGTLIEYRLRVHRAPIRWQTLIQEWVPDGPCPRFVDTQLRGPYALWHHTHTFEPTGTDRTLMTDTVRYAIGFGPLGEVAHRLIVRRDVAAIFEHRERVVPDLIARDIVRRRALSAV